MAQKLEELKQLSDDEVIERHNKAAEHTVAGTKYWTEELNRRYVERQTNALVRYTKWITRFTVAVTVATLINVGFVVATFFER